jgi:phosphoglycerate dehydrogenase-like enzyme
MSVVFAEMPEAAERDLSIERRHLPPGALIDQYIYTGDRQALAAACREADAIVTDYVPFDGEVLGALGRCRIISVAATGWDCVDVAAAAKRGIRVSAVGEYCTDEVADHTLALLLALNRRLIAYHRQVQERNSWLWNEIHGVRRLAGQTLGLIGFGRIGQAVCRRALGFGLSAGFDELLAESDILSLHCNLDQSNRGLLDRGAFARMRKSPLLINVARGGLIVEADLIAALEQGQVAAAALDVLAEDSPDLARHPLAGRRDVLLTPHVAFYSDSALADLRRISANNVRAFVEGRPGDVFRLVPPPEAR